MITPKITYQEAYIDGGEIKFRKTSAISKPGIVSLAIYIQYHTGCRISELLRVKIYQLLKTGIMSVPGSKKGRPVVHQLSTTEMKAFGVYDSRCEIGDIYSRFFFYREYKKYGITFKRAHGVRVSVTHALRHMLAERVQKVATDDSQVTEALHHKSNKSRDHYLR